MTADQSLSALKSDGPSSHKIASTFDTSGKTGAGRHAPPADRFEEARLRWSGL